MVTTASTASCTAQQHTSAGDQLGGSNALRNCGRFEASNPRFYLHASLPQSGTQLRNCDVRAAGLLQVVASRIQDCVLSAVLCCAAGWLASQDSGLGPSSSNPSAHAHHDQCIGHRLRGNTLPRYALSCHHCQHKSHSTLQHSTLQAWLEHGTAHCSTASTHRSGARTAAWHAHVKSQTCT